MSECQQPQRLGRIFLTVSLCACHTAPPPTLGPLTSGELYHCPPTNNCASSLAHPNNTQHYVPPIGFTADPERAMQRLAQIMAAMPRSKLITNNGEYIHAEFRSRLLCFVDDVEFIVQPGSGLIHFRSAARSGDYDFGVNKQRMVEIRRLFANP